MERQHKIVVALVLALLAAGGIAVAASGRERSLAVYPAQRMPMAFDHALHLDEGAECESCHETATKSVRSVDKNMPKHPECESCHDIEAASKGKKTDPASGCEVCHLGFDHTVQKAPAQVLFPAPNLKFPHKKHVDLKIKCESCHGTMKDVSLATRMQLPRMDNCLQCHDDSHAPGACNTCHLTGPTGKLQLNFTSGVLRPQQGDPFGMDHGPRFEFTHGTRAAAQRGMCMQCHQESDCQSCHDSLQKPLSVHPNDYITLHPVEARMDTPRCDSCHRRQSFCVACHERAGVGMDSNPALRALNVRVHPVANFYAPNPLAPEVFHGVEASRNIGSCMACHREESCMACHANAGVNAGAFNAAKQSNNPHPAGFVGMCKGLAGKNSRPCLKCHAAADLSNKGCLP
jgi:hypothetical protein